MCSAPASQLVQLIRARTGQSQEELARELGVSFATVNAWERGRSNPRERHYLTLCARADELGVLPGLTVLVIDDDEDAVALAEALLERLPESVEILTATSGFDGLLLCGSHLPDLVLLDVRMPGIDGFEVARALQRVGGLEGTELYFVTAHPVEGLEQRAARAGARGVLHKPLTLPAVEAVVSSLQEQGRSLSG